MNHFYMEHLHTNTSIPLNLGSTTRLASYVIYDVGLSMFQSCLPAVTEVLIYTHVFDINSPTSSYGLYKLIPHGFHDQPQVVLVTGAGIGRAVQVWHVNTGRFGSRPVQKFEPLIVASATNISFRAEWLRQSGQAPSEPSETPRWRITPRAAPIPRVALHISLRLLFHRFFSPCWSFILNGDTGGEGQL